MARDAIGEALDLVKGKQPASGQPGEGPAEDRVAKALRMVNARTEATTFRVGSVTYHRLPYASPGDADNDGWRMGRNPHRE